MLVMKTNKKQKECALRNEQKAEKMLVKERTRSKVKAYHRMSKEKT